MGSGDDSMSFRIVEETPFPDLHSRGTGSIVTERNGYILRTRGEHNRLVRHDYRCPVHGVFEATTPSGEVPDVMLCPFDSCTKMSPWQYPSVAQGISAGKVKS